ncbi:hypothetical protein ACFL5I_01025 [Planctomycetota bacterium]
MSNIGKEFRLAEFFNKLDNRTLLLDTSDLASLGLTEVAARLWPSLEKLDNQLDALIVNPGQMTRLAERLKGKSLITRLDWTNLLRTQDFILPATEIKHVAVATPEDVFSLGATAAVCYLLFGYDENMESSMIEYIATITRTCYKLGLPLLVDIYPTGPKITKVNFDAAVELAASMMQEAGVDVLIIPPVSLEKIKEMQRFIKIPILVRLANKKEAKSFVVNGCAGISLALKTPLQDITAIKKIVH